MHTTGTELFDQLDLLYNYDINEMLVLRLCLNKLSKTLGFLEN